MGPLLLRCLWGLLHLYESLYGSRSLRGSSCQRSLGLPDSSLGPPAHSMQAGLADASVWQA